MNNDINIDKLLADTWLTVSMLKHATSIADGKLLYRNCVAQVESVRTALKEAGLDEESIAHISYAQCALLDETVLNRTAGEGANADDTLIAHAEWRSVPLQARFFGSLRAGEALWDRVAEILRQPAPRQEVLTCYQRVLSLGFQGVYGTAAANPALRQQALDLLNERVSPLDPELSLVVSKTRLRHFRWFRSAWFWAGVALIVTGLVWWGGHLWLQSLLSAQLPELCS
ncbi:type VI secretion system protein TssL, short form [Type-D symbiont of Plautia stali]|uniref:type VI secretion system protein TssL, short form n=1 Tax=Type-D symbiont of Plautia stali TaxID=1560356 RepID=UPI00073E1BA0|nr:type VI secretion system protein TssL, short form [Type-D symbiont of Plautia stali]